MKAAVFHAIGDSRLEDVPEPAIEQPIDAIVRLTISAISARQPAGRPAERLFVGTLGLKAAVTP